MADLSTAKADREYENLTVERLDCDIIVLGWKGCIDSSDLDVMR